MGMKMTVEQVDTHSNVSFCTRISQTERGNIKSLVKFKLEFLQLTFDVQTDICLLCWGSLGVGQYAGWWQLLPVTTSSRPAVSDSRCVGWQWSSHQITGQLWWSTDHQEPRWQHASTFHHSAIITLPRQVFHWVALCKLFRGKSIHTWSTVTVAYVCA